MITFTRDEANRELPYRLICETRDGCRWNTARRRRLWAERFSEQERTACSRLFNMARRWTLSTGVPSTISMSSSTFALWMRLGQFCAEL